MRDNGPSLFDAAPGPGLTPAAGPLAAPAAHAPERVRGGAVFSPCGAYRYALSREWGPDGEPAEPARRCMFVMLNPSTADADTDDPTVRRCIGFAQAWGMLALVVVNLYAFRATHPRDIFGKRPKTAKPIGEGNADAIARALGRVGGPIVAAWGVYGGENGRGWFVTHDLTSRGRVVHCLGTTRAGMPRHPLYVASGTPLEIFASPEPSEPEPC